jgi:glutamate formiminotransferase/formiminotetrahydrofolate cyclodeaminase
VRKFENVDARMRAAIPPLHAVTRELITMIDADTNAFNEYMEGIRMPSGTPEEKAARTAKMQKGLKTAVQVPLQTMTLGDSAWDVLIETARYGNPASRSDVQVGARALETGIWGAYQNVLINLEGITDTAFREETLKVAGAMADRGRKKMEEVLDILEKQRAR